MVDAFIPGSKFAAVSITGSKCWLNCKYCMGKYLKGMEHTPTPHHLKAFAKKFYKQGGRGILISGGFTREGKLPFTPFLQTIREIKKEYDFVISVHPGLVNKDDAENLRLAGVDIVDFDFT
ncbi:MAG: radical SAM protein, partial [Thermoproteales archaeon]|nr:radical SAM protein [Thermoproteales archaeon]